MANLLVKDCVIRNYVNSFIDFVDAAPSQKIRIESLEVDNTQAFDLGRNNSDHASFISTTVKGNVLCRKYVIRNSTFHHLMRGLIEARVTGAIDNYSTPTVVIENCTFDEIGNMQPMIEGSWTGDNNGMTKPFLDFKGGALKCIHRKYQINLFRGRLLLLIIHICLLLLKVNYPGILQLKLCWISVELLIAFSLTEMDITIEFHRMRESVISEIRDGINHI